MTDMSAARPPPADANAHEPATAFEPAAPEVGAPTTPAAPDPLRRSLTSTIWIGVIVFALVLVLLLIFILQNTQPVEISFFALSGTVSLAVAMLLAAVAGVLLTAIAGSLRIWQLRRRMPHPDRS